MEESIREAAAWFARLQAENCSAEDRAAHRRWLAEDGCHAEAFSLMAGVWAASPDVAARQEGRAVTRRVVVAAVMAAAAVFGVPRRAAEAAIWRCGTGERRVFSDGPDITAVFDSRTKAVLDPSGERLRLVEGRMGLVVWRAFTVGTDLCALSLRQGQLDLRRIDGVTSVTVLSGWATVTGGGRAAFRLDAGQRVTWRAGQAPVLDRPDLRDLTAWREGQLVFHDTTLAQAAAEMNRYTARPIVIASPDVAAMRISGRFRAADDVRFLHALEAILPVRALAVPGGGARIVKVP